MCGSHLEVLHRTPAGVARADTILQRAAAGESARRWPKMSGNGRKIGQRPLL
jgi:hypothetical protein